LKDYLGVMGVKGAAARLRVERATLSRIPNVHAGITAGMSLRLSAALGTSPEF
jgi:addiction module HigA family antidote